MHQNKLLPHDCYCHSNFIFDRKFMIVHQARIQNTFSGRYFSKKKLANAYKINYNVLFKHSQSNFQQSPNSSTEYATGVYQKYNIHYFKPFKQYGITMIKDMSFYFNTIWLKIINILL